MAKSDKENGVVQEQLQPKILLGVNGCLGRMGRRLCVLASQNPQLSLVAAQEYVDHPSIGELLSKLIPDLNQSNNILITPSGTMSSLPTPPEIIIDFSSPSGTVSCSQDAAKGNISLVIGTTGLSAEEEAVIDNVSKSVGVIHAMNYSLGVNLLFSISAQVAKALGEDFNIEIVEAHHNKKVDAPSGTAYGIADSICEALGKTRKDLVHGREGQVGKRTSQEIGVHSMRMGGVIGDHTVHFGSEFERIEITHRAEDRDVFAAGAIKAALWLGTERRKALGANSQTFKGKFCMKDVLFGKK